MPLSDIPFLTSLKPLHGFAANCVCIPGGGGGYQLRLNRGGTLIFDRIMGNFVQFMTK